jgi:hypothetical protein
MSKSTKPKKVFTENEWIAGRHAFLSWALRKIADHCEKWEHDPDEIIEYMREIADEHEAQEMVVKLRDELLKGNL